MEIKNREGKTIIDINDDTITEILFTIIIIIFMLKTC